MLCKVFVPKNPRLTSSFEEVHTFYSCGGNDYIVNRNTRKEGYLVFYSYEYWSLGYEEPDFGEGDIATFCSFKSALEWINRHGVIDDSGSYIYLIESDKYMYWAHNVLKSTKRSEKSYKEAVSDLMVCRPQPRSISHDKENSRLR